MGARGEESSPATPPAGHPPASGDGTALLHAIQYRLGKPDKIHPQMQQGPAVRLRNGVYFPRYRYLVARAQHTIASGRVRPDDGYVERAILLRASRRRGPGYAQLEIAHIFPLVRFSDVGRVQHPPLGGRLSKFHKNHPFIVTARAAARTARTCRLSAAPPPSAAAPGFFAPCPARKAPAPREPCPACSIRR